MNYYNEKYEAQFNKIIKKWDSSGQFILKEESVVYHQAFGYKDREVGTKTTIETPYTFDLYEDQFVKMAILLLIDAGKLKFKSLMSDFIPEYKFAGDITIKQLLEMKSGIKCFYHEALLVPLEDDKAHNALDSHSKLRVEKLLYYKNRSFEKVFDLIKDQSLVVKPGVREEYSLTNTIFLGEIVERITKTSLFDFLNQSIFKPFNMTGVKLGDNKEVVSAVVYNNTELVRMPYDFEIDGLIQITSEDIKKFVQAYADKGFYSKKMWKKILKYNKDNEGLLTDRFNGFDCFSISFLGFTIYANVDFETNRYCITLLSEEQTFVRENGEWQSLNRDIREVVETIYAYPSEKTQMVELSEKNLWSALRVDIEEDQHNYVLEAKSSIAMGLTYKHEKVFVQMEGDLTVGLLVVTVDKKKEEYYINIIIIDKRFQGRGYGKMMVQWAVDYLKKNGATRLTIGVHRENIGAKKIYMNAGFKPCSVYSEGMELAIDLRDNQA